MRALDRKRTMEDDSKVKVLYVISRLSNEGPVNQLYSQIKGDSMTQYSIVTLFPEMNGSRMDEFKRMNIPIMCLKLHGKEGVFFCKRKMERVLRDIKPDIIHSATLPADIAVSRIKRKNMPWVSTMHCNIYTDYPMRFGKMLGAVNIFCHEQAMKKMTVIAGCSRYIADVYHESGNKIVSIQNGIDTKKYCVIDKKTREIMRTRLGLPLDKTIIVIVGSIDKRKNSKFIIETLKEWIKIHDSVLIFLGKGELFEECQKDAEDKKEIYFKGKVDNVQEYLQCSDIYLSASRSEGLPLSVLEAGACGLTMVLSDIPQHKEIFENYNGEAVFFFHLHDRKKFISAMEEAEFSINKNEIKSEEYIKSYFDISGMSEKYRELYRQMKIS